MAKISELLTTAPADPLDGSEGFHALQDGASTGATVEQVGDYVAARADVQNTSEKGVANGYASLNSSGRVPAAQLSGGSDVAEYANLAAFPGTGEVGTIYIALDTDLSYIWDDDSSTYVSISSSSATLPATGGFKLACRRVATSNVDIATGGIVSIDGGNTVNKDRILLAGQTAPAENGIYVCNSAGAWARANDANVVSEVRASIVTVWQGTTYGGTIWATTFEQGNTLGTTAQNWFQIAHVGNVVAMIDAILGSSAWQSGGGGGVTDFLDLGDVPAAYTGEAGKGVRVKGDESGLEFYDLVAGTPFSITVAASDETTALTTGTAKVSFRMPHGATLSEVRASVTTAPTGGTLLTVDINEGGSSILSTKLTFDASEKTTTTAATPAVISDASLADDSEITIDIDAVGSTIAGAGLKVTLIGVRT